MASKTCLKCNGEIKMWQLYFDTPEGPCHFDCEKVAADGTDEKKSSELGIGKKQTNLTEGPRKVVATCCYCQREIFEDQRRYFSRQAGMRGWYHWECFVEACKEANKAGMRQIGAIDEGVFLPDDLFDTPAFNEALR